MSPHASKGYYVTGTDTGVGKTVACVALLHAFRASGRSAVGMKPVASGCVDTPDGLRNDDALALQRASSNASPYHLVNPFALPEPTAPQIAAALSGIDVTLPPMIEAYRSLSRGVEVVIVEGVGGWLAPLADGLEQSALAAALELPVLLVVAVKLGCLSHARLSVRAIRADGLRVAGWIGNATEEDYPHSLAYRALLEKQIDAPCLGHLPYWPDSQRGAMAATLRLPG